MSEHSMCSAFVRVFLPVSCPRQGGHGEGERQPQGAGQRQPGTREAIGSSSGRRRGRFLKISLNEAGQASTRVHLFLALCIHKHLSTKRCLCYCMHAQAGTLSYWHPPSTNGSGSSGARQLASHVLCLLPDQCPWALYLVFHASLSCL